MLGTHAMFWRQGKHAPDQRSALGCRGEMQDPSIISGKEAGFPCDSSKRRVWKSPKENQELRHWEKPLSIPRHAPSLAELSEEGQSCSRCRAPHQPYHARPEGKTLSSTGAAQPVSLRQDTQLFQPTNSPAGAGTT